MNSLRILLLLILLALLGYAGVSFLSPDRQEGEVKRSGSKQPDSVVVGIPEQLIDAALQVDSVGLGIGDKVELSSGDSQQKSQSSD